jgi:hypothetical protein
VPTAAAAVLHVMLGVLPSTTASGHGLPRIAVDPGVSTPPTELATRCAPGTELPDDFLTALSEALSQADEGVVRGSLEVLERDARAAVLVRPDDVEARYRLAAVIGASLEQRSGSTKVSAAKEVHALVVRVLEDAPGHAGANYLLGRLHAGVLRLDRVSRFLATGLLGGGALRSASWEEARTLLELSEREDPCVAEHHLELARVYAERGDAADAARELAHVLQLTQGSSGRDGRIRERAEQLGRAWRPRER